MINAENVLLVKRLQQDLDQFLGGGLVAAERFFHNDPRAILGATRLGELLHHGSKQRRWNGEVMSGLFRGAEFFLDGLKGCRVIVIAVHIAQQLGEFFKRRRVEAAMLFENCPLPGL